MTLGPAMQKTTQVLLKNNTRASVALAVLSFVPLLIGLLVVSMTFGRLSIIAFLGWLMLMGGLVLTIRQIWWLVLPRLACSITMAETWANSWRHG